MICAPLFDRKIRQRFFFCLGAAFIVGAYLVLGAVGLGMFAVACYILFFPSRKGIPVLVYHSVNPNRDWMGARDLVVSPELFECQMDWLVQKGYRSLWMDELLLASKKRISTPCVAIHFDDGYLDTMVYAEPLLKKHKLRGTLFVSPALLRDAPNHKNLHLHKDLDSKNFLSSKELRELSLRNIIEVQSHGWTHREMGLMDIATLQSELKDTRLWLSSLLQREVLHICFPRDSRSETVISAALDSGYVGYTGGAGCNSLGDNPNEISRLYVTEGGCLAFDMILFKMDILLFCGVYAIWPFRAVCKRLLHYLWRIRNGMNRMTP